MKHELVNLCLIEYLKLNQTDFSVYSFSPEIDIGSCRVAAVCLGVEFICCSSLPEKADCANFEPVTFDQ